MGKPMAMNLIKSGDVVAVHDIRQRGLTDFESHGVQASTDPLVLVDGRATTQRFGHEEDELGLEIFPDGGISRLRRPIRLLTAGKLGKILLSAGSMLLSVVIYGKLFGWRYAVGFVALLWIHEMGHFVAARQRGHTSLVP